MLSKQYKQLPTYLYSIQTHVYIHICITYIEAGGHHMVKVLCIQSSISQDFYGFKMHLIYPSTSPTIFEQHETKIFFFSLSRLSKCQWFLSSFLGFAGYLTMFTFCTLSTFLRLDKFHTSSIYFWVFTGVPCLTQWSIHWFIIT